MKKYFIKVIILVCIIYLLILASCSKNEKMIRFLLIKNGKNLILYNSDIEKSFVDKTIKYYDTFVRKVLAYNISYSENLDISKNEILIIILKDNYQELKKINSKFIKKIEKYRNNPNHINLAYIYNDLNYVKPPTLPTIGMYLPLQDVIVLMGEHFISTNNEGVINLCFLILAEYNHYLITKNLIRNFGKRYIDYALNSKYDYEIHKIKKLFDESITCFYSFYYSLFFQSKLIDDMDLILNSDLLFDKDFITGYLKQYVNTLYKKENIEDLKSFFYGDLKYISLIVYDLYLSIFISEKFGIEKLYKLINFLYFGNYLSVNEITQSVFGVDENTFYNLWTDIVKK